jgi:predicted dehydrogenase
MKPGSPGWGRDPDPLVFVGGDEGGPVELAAPAGDYLAYYTSIRDAVRGEGAPPVTAEEATTVMAVIEAGIRSSAEGRVVPLHQVLAGNSKARIGVPGPLDADRLTS